MGITHAGKPGKQRFCEITGAEQQGHSVFYDDFPIAVKTTESLNANQVRAHLWAVLVIFDKRTGDWYVIPPHIVYAIATSKPGQHQPFGIVCAQFDYEDFKDYRVSSEALLESAVQDAILLTHLNTYAESHCKRKYKEILDLAEEHRKQVS